MTITEFIKELKKEDPNITSFELFKMAHNDPKVLSQLCYIMMQTYQDHEHIKKFL